MFYVHAPVVYPFYFVILGSLTFNAQLFEYEHRSFGFGLVFGTCIVGLEGCFLQLSVFNGLLDPESYEMQRLAV